MSEQTKDTELKEEFSSVAQQLATNESKIIQELNDAQGSTVDMGGYYWPDTTKVADAMRPSETLNKIIGG